MTPTFETLKTVAAALHTHPVLLVAGKKPEQAWTWTQHEFAEWKLKLGAAWNGNVRLSRSVPVRAVDMVDVFLATRPDHDYVREKLLEHALCSPENPEVSASLDAEKWAREAATAEAARQRAKRRKALTPKTG